MATNVHLTPELERFAHACVEGGRYTNVSDVVRSALRLLQDVEDRRHRFQAMLENAEAEADQVGALPLEQVLAEVDGIIARAQS